MGERRDWARADAVCGGLAGPVLATRPRGGGSSSRAAYVGLAGPVLAVRVGMSQGPGVTNA